MPDQKTIVFWNVHKKGDFKIYVHITPTLDSYC